MKPKDFEQALLELAMTTSVPLTRANILFYTGVAARQAEKWLDELLRDGILEFDTDDDGELLYTVCGAKRPAGGPTELARCAACQRVTGAASRCARCGQYLDTRLRALKDEVDRERRASGVRTSPSTANRSSTGRPIIDVTDVSEEAARSRSPARGRASGADLLQMVRELDRYRRDGFKPTVADEKNVAVAGVLGLFGPLGWFYAAPHKEAGAAAVLFLLAVTVLPKIIYLPILMLLLPISALVGVLYAWQYNRSGHRTSLFLDDSDDAGSDGHRGGR